MQPTFKPPKDEAEFKKRADELTLSQAEQMVGILRKRREAAVKPIDAEILFFKKVIEHKQKES